MAVAFPDKRARNINDCSDALQAALEKIKNTPELNTLYIGPGIYLWPGLCGRASVGRESPRCGCGRRGGRDIRQPGHTVCNMRG